MALVDWLHTHYGRRQGAPRQPEAGGTSRSPGPLSTLRHQSPQLQGLEAGVSSLQSLHATSQGLLSLLTRLDGAERDMKRLLSVMDEAHA
jgi:hypothetical protein